MQTGEDQARREVEIPTFAKRSRPKDEHRSAGAERDEKYEAASQRFREEALASNCYMPHFFQRE